MTDWMRKILESKRVMRQHLATRSFSEKVAVLEKLRSLRVLWLDGEKE